MILPYFEVRLWCTGVCKKGDSCEFAHGVFECWLHPDRYRTQPCKDGPNCPRRVCFFAHFPDQLRILPQQQSPSSVESDYSSPGRLCPDSHQLAKSAHFLSSPTSVLISPPISPPSNSPPVSPNGIHSVNELVASMRGLSFGKSKLSQKSHFASGFGLTRRPNLCTGSNTNNSMPSSPTQAGLGGYDLWESPYEEEPAMERVESGRDIRAQIYAKLSKDNPLDRADPPGSGPDVGWVLELVKWSRVWRDESWLQILDPFFLCRTWTEASGGLGDSSDVWMLCILSLFMVCCKYYKDRRGSRTRILVFCGGFLSYGSLLMKKMKKKKKKIGDRRRNCTEQGRKD